MYLYICICVYIYIYIHTHTHTCVYIYTHTHTLLYIYTYIHTYIHIYVHTYVHTYIHTYIHNKYIHTYYAKSRDGVALVVIRLQVGESRVQIPAEARNFLLLQNVYVTQGPFHCPLHWLPGFFLGVKLLGSDLDQSLPSSAKVKSEWNNTSARPVCLRGTYWHKFTFYL